RDPDRRPQTMGALEYELTKSAKGRGSAVAAVLGLKPAEEPGQPWDESSSRPRPLFEIGMVQTRRPAVPASAVQRTGTTGALPLSADEDRVSVNRPAASRDGLAEAFAADDKRMAERAASRKPTSSSSGGGKIATIVVGGLLLLTAAGGVAYYK